jgi:hypothetical protein
VATVSLDQKRLSRAKGNFASQPTAKLANLQGDLAPPLVPKRQRLTRYSPAAAKAAATSARRFASVKKSMAVMASALAPSMAA